MKLRSIYVLLLGVALQIPLYAFAREWKPQEWPVLKHYDQSHLDKIALPLGGIGTGTVSLGGRGELKDWELMNVPAKGYSTVTPGGNAPLFSIYVNSPSQGSQTRGLLGPLYDHEYLHYEGRPVDHHGVPRFETASFDAAYPFGQVHLSDGAMPVEVTIKGFNPFIPTDAEASGIPIAVLSYEVKNTSSEVLDVSIAGSMRNFIGKDGSKYTSNWKGDFVPIGANKNRNSYVKKGGIQGIFMTSEGVDRSDPAWGTMALTTQAMEGVSYRTTSIADDWNNASLNFWDDFSADGVLTELGAQVDDDPMASLAVKRQIAPHSSEVFTFFITWTFPNRTAWYKKEIVGNYYTTQYADAWDVVEKTVPNLSNLEATTLNFVNAFISSDYPEVVKESALFNLATLRSQTVFRLPSGHLMGWEGVMDRFGSCQGSCTHVWNYEVATPFLFGDLARTMRDVEFNYAMRPDGAMSFRADLPLSNAATGGTAADGQMGCVMKFYRDWQLVGDLDYLKENWAQVKLALSYAWVEKGWDANQDGVMEGSQHNTMDVDYFGPNPQMGFWYLGALKAGERMAKAVGDKTFAKKCKRLYTEGSEWLDKYLFNGEYYEHKITNPKNHNEFLNIDDPNVEIPPFQLGKGCLVDQLVGQYMSHICDLGYLGSKENAQTTYRSILKYNYVPNFSTHFNNMRSYAMGDEAGLLMASWPKGRLKVPFPYFAEVMTGFEYSTAVGMMYEGMVDEALMCVKAIRDRHNGAKRNPFSEPECGHHYARSMASWGLVLAYSKFHYSGVDRKMQLTHQPGAYFWSNGYAWGVCTVSKDAVKVEVLKGTLKLNELELTDGRSKRIRVGEIAEGNSYVIPI